MLSEIALGVYKQIIGSPDQDLETVAFEMGVTERQLDSALDELVSAGLVQRPPGGGRATVVALAPEVALAQSVSSDQLRLQELEVSIAQRRAAYLSLVPHFVAAQESASRSAAGTELVEDLTTVQHYLAELCREVRRELLIAHPTRFISAQSLAEGLPQDLAMLARGVTRRSIYLTSNRDSAAVRRAVQTVSDAGAEVRVLPVIPLRVMIFDGSIALISRAADPQDKAAIVVRDTDLTHCVRTLFQAAWDSAEPFMSPNAQPSNLSSLEQAILRDLSNGLSDEQIARRQRISVRTVRRYVSEMMQRLGADTRFHAGYLAARRNLS